MTHSGAPCSCGYMAGYIVVHDGPIPIGRPASNDQDDDLFFRLAAAGNNPTVSERAETGRDIAGAISEPDFILTAEQTPAATSVPPELSESRAKAADIIRLAADGQADAHLERDLLPGHETAVIWPDDRQQVLTPCNAHMHALSSSHLGLLRLPAPSARQRLTFVSPPVTPQSSAPAPQLQAGDGVPAADSCPATALPHPGNRFPNVGAQQTGTLHQQCTKAAERNKSAGPAAQENETACTSVSSTSAQDGRGSEQQLASSQPRWLTSNHAPLKVTSSVPLKDELSFHANDTAKVTASISTPGELQGQGHPRPGISTPAEHLSLGQADHAPAYSAIGTSQVEPMAERSCPNAQQAEQGNIQHDHGSVARNSPRTASQSHDQTAGKGGEGSASTLARAKQLLARRQAATLQHDSKGSSLQGEAAPEFTILTIAEARTEPVEVLSSLDDPEGHHNRHSAVGQQSAAEQQPDSNALEGAAMEQPEASVAGSATPEAMEPVPTTAAKGGDCSGNGAVSLRAPSSALQEELLTAKDLQDGIPASLPVEHEMLPPRQARSATDETEAAGVVVSIPLPEVSRPATAVSEQGSTSTGTPDTHLKYEQQMDSDNGGQPLLPGADSMQGHLQEGQSGVAGCHDGHAASQLSGPNSSAHTDDDVGKSQRQPAQASEPGLDARLCACSKTVDSPAAPHDMQLSGAPAQHVSHEHQHEPPLQVEPALMVAAAASSSALPATSPDPQGTMAELEHPVHGEQAEDAQSAGGPPDTDALRDGQVGKLRDSQVTDAELLALAREVERLEAALGAAQWAAERSASEAASARAEAEALRARLSEAREQAEDDKAELEAVRGAYTDMRGEAESARNDADRLRQDLDALQKQTSTFLQQAAEGKKMQMRLEKAERALEQERATVRELQHALQASQHASPSASPRKTDGQLRAALAAAQKELLEATVSLEAQKQTSNGLQIRVEELLRAAAEVERLRHENAELQRKAGAVQASEQQRRELEAAVPVLREQNNVLHVTTERLLTTNSELTAKVNEQALLISTLKQQLAAATVNFPSTRSASKSAGVRFSETELELLALAEYVQELEAALERQKAISAGSQSSDIAPGQRGPDSRPSSSLSNPAAEEADAHDPSRGNWAAPEGAGAAGAQRSAGPTSSHAQEKAASGGATQDARLDSQQSKVHAQRSAGSAGQSKEQGLRAAAKPRRTSLWGYITGADKTPMK